MTGLPRSAGLSRCSTAAKNASRSTWRIVRGAVLTHAILSRSRATVLARRSNAPGRESKPPGARRAGRWIGRRSEAGASALGLDDDRDLGRHAREHLDRDLVGAQRLDRLLEVDLVAVDGNP